jgi:hypothetical protein
MNTIDIKKYFKVCDSCKGEKYRWVHSHDCWGKSESDQVCCYTCSGKGFVMDRDLKNQVQKILGIK